MTHDNSRISVGAAEEILSSMISEMNRHHKLHGDDAIIKLTIACHHCGPEVGTFIFSKNPLGKTKI